jgi:hydroxymethylpyrimidine pyrophosphatase-like HAD family hydrolase
MDEMQMFFAAVVFDCDGTRAKCERVDTTTREAITRERQSERCTRLVTDRQFDEL